MLRSLLFTLALAWATAGVPVQAQQAGDVLTAQDVFDLEFVQDPQISPDGSRVVFVREFSDIKTDRRYTNLWLTEADGSNQRPLTTGKYSDESPRWSRDGERLLYLSDRSGSTQIHVRWMDSGEVTQITDLVQRPRVPAWSPDGSQIAFSSFVPTSGLQLISMPNAPEGAEWAKPARVITEMVHRFDGTGDLEHGYTHVFVVPSEGGTPRQLTSGNFHHGGYVGRSGGGRPVWTPDGTAILLSANRHADWELENRNTEVYRVSLDGTIEALTDRKGPDGGVVVSPDGRHIAYSGFDDRYQGYQVRGLFVANSDGSNPRAVAAELDRTVGGLTWAPDSGHLYFSYDDHGNTKIGRVDPDGGAVQVVAENVGGTGSAYSGGAFSVGPSGSVAYTYSTPDVLSELAFVQAGQTRVVTDVNGDVLGHKALGDVEEIRWASSYDEREIQGWIVKPPGFDPDRRYPFILEIHGGPFANYGDRFDVEKQAMASAGYVVLYTNPRGSTSYGEEFGNLIHHAYPGNDFYDLDSGVDALIARGYVDPNQLYITGGSGGGVLSSWSIGKTDRYRAAAVLYPVINWYSFALSSDIPITVAKYWFPDMPWENPEHYMERSSISLVGSVNTPTMVMTGEEDYRTPMSESDQYYQALKLKGVEAVLVKMPGEPHGLRVRPSHFMQKILYITGWFDRFRMST